MLEKEKLFNLKPLFIFSLVFFVFLFLKISWVTEDAYISFRVVEQFFDGNGLRWNPHERVQAFTHPLWMLVLIFFRLFTKDVFLMVLIPSFIFCLSTLFLFPRLIQNRALVILAIFHLCLSKAFMDFSTSGLENPLSYFLTGCFLLFYLKEEGAKNFGKLTLILGLAIITRHDLGTLLILPWLFKAWEFFRQKGFKSLLAASLLGFSPFILWTVFSLIYYGFPFPNTAYAKLYTGVPSSILFYQGYLYIRDSATRDPILILTVITSFIFSISEKNKKFIFLGFGFLLHLFYIIKVGGDFMSGRFLTSVFLASVIFIWHFLDRKNVSFIVLYPRKILAMGLLFILGYYGFFPRSPVLAQSTNQINPEGIADERGFYLNGTTLEVYLKSPSQFPAFRWVGEGLQFKNSDQKVTLRATIGMFSYYAGLEKIVVDVLALTDPLLSRLPTRVPWRIGHFSRVVPEGYIKSLETGENMIKNPDLFRLYEKIKIVTQGPLFSSERWKAILKLNLGF